MVWYDIYLTAIGLTLGGSNAVHVYAEQHSGTEYLERNIHNNKNT